MKKILSEIAVLCFFTGCAMATEEACQENEHINEGVCEKDTLEQCGSTENNCTRQKGWKKGICAEGQCVATDCKDGFVIKNGKCTSSTPDLECADDEHVYGKKCEKDTLDHCGEHDNNCSEIEGWSSGRCSKGECIVTECADGYELKGSKCSKIAQTTTIECARDTHPFESGCENDSLNHCGSHENDCTMAEGWKDGLCQNSTCFVTECQAGYIISNGKCTVESVDVPPPAPECGEGTHLYEGECEEDTTENCGTHGVNCANIDGWLSGTCTDGICTVSSCKEDYNLTDGACVAVVPLECSETQHVYDGKCEDDSVENCGVHGTACTNMTGWLTGTCNNKMCVPAQCNSGFCIDQSTHICINGITTSACGINGGACSVCSPGQKCNNGQCETPLPECKADEHLHETSCETDTAEHCGSHNNKCQIANASGHKCESKQCFITGCNSGFHPYNNTCEANDNDNCGKHNNPCGENNPTNAKTGACNKTSGVCYATSCNSNSHLHDYYCEPDDNDNCGSHGVACKTTDYPYSLKVQCVSKACKVMTCKAGLEISGNKCVGQNGCPAQNPYYCSGGCCQKAGCSGSCLLME